MSAEQDSHNESLSHEILLAKLPEADRERIVRLIRAAANIPSSGISELEGVLDDFLRLYLTRLDSLKHATRMLADQADRQEELLTLNAELEGRLGEAESKIRALEERLAALVGEGS